VVILLVQRVALLFRAKLRTAWRAEELGSTGGAAGKMGCQRGIESSIQPAQWPFIEGDPELKMTLWSSDRKRQTNTIGAGQAAWSLASRS